MAIPVPTLSGKSMKASSLQRCIVFLFFAFFFSARAFAWEQYEVQILGIENKETLEVLKCSSQLLALKNKPPSSDIALKRRAEADVQNFIKALHSLAYYNAKIDLEMDVHSNPAAIRFNIDPGPVYPIADFKVISDESSKTERLPSEKDCKESPLSNLPLQGLGIVLDKPALAENIVEAEDLLLQHLAQKGYPLASITKRDIVADQQEKALRVALYVNMGPKVCFGSTTINGLTSVREEYFKKKIGWKPGKVYDPGAVERTQAALEASGLFSSICIAEGEEASDGCALPMTIDVIEAKHRSIAGGISYATQRGPGVNLEWEHRNIRGMGERFTAKTNLWKDTQEGTFLYVIPDFKRTGQDLLLTADVEHDLTKGFTDTSFSLSAVIEKQVNDSTRLSYGGQYKFIKSSHTDNDREFNLIKAPFQLRWNNANNVLNPTLGSTLSMKVTPSMQLVHPQFCYCLSTLTGTVYQPVTSDHRLVIAGKALFGTIFGASRHSIPPSERFYAGSENTLRGYEYLTVSPLGKDDKPIGGRSMMIFSLEARIRFTEKFGAVGFYDFGNVYSSTFPQIKHKQLSSAGVGLRYHTPVGPIRLDIAFPLDRRRHYDSPFQIYLNIGQSF